MRSHISNTRFPFVLHNAIEQQIVQLVFLSMVFLVSIFLSGHPAFSQSPIAQAELNGRTLELWSIEIGRSFDVKRERDMAFGGIRTGDLQKLKDAGKLSESALGRLGMQYPRWKDMLVHEQKSAILGMLVREPSGKIASPQLSFSSPVRFRGDDGKTASSWPDDDNDSLLSSRVSYAWDEKVLSAFAVPITDKTKMLEMVEGFAVLSPCKRHEFVFEISDLESKSRKTDGEVTVLPLDYAASNDGMQVSFQMFRPMKEMKDTRKSSRKAGRPQPTEEEIIENLQESRLQAVGYELLGRTADGSLVRPNTSMAVSNSRQLSSDASIKTELRLRTKDSKEKTTQDSDRKKIAANLAFDAFGYRFSNKSAIKSVLVTVIENEGSESYERFQFENISLDQVGQRGKLKEYLASLERAAPSSEIQKRSSKTVRVWRDKTGKFSVKAQLVTFDGKKVLLQKEDGSTLEVPHEKLSDEDKAYVDKL